MYYYKVFNLEGELLFTNTSNACYNQLFLGAAELLRITKQGTIPVKIVQMLPKSAEKSLVQYVNLLNKWGYDFQIEENSLEKYWDKDNWDKYSFSSFLPATLVFNTSSTKNLADLKLGLFLSRRLVESTDWLNKYIETLDSRFNFLDEFQWLLWSQYKISLTQGHPLFYFYLFYPPGFYGDERKHGNAANLLVTIKEAREYLSNNISNSTRISIDNLFCHFINNNTPPVKAVDFYLTLTDEEMKGRPNLIGCLANVRNLSPENVEPYETWYLNVIKNRLKQKEESKKLEIINKQKKIAAKKAPKKKTTKKLIAHV